MQVHTFSHSIEDNFENLVSKRMKISANERSLPPLRMVLSEMWASELPPLRPQREDNVTFPPNLTPFLKTEQLLNRPIQRDNIASSSSTSHKYSKEKESSRFYQMQNNFIYHDKSTSPSSSPVNKLKRSHDKISSPLSLPTFHQTEKSKKTDTETGHIAWPSSCEPRKYVPWKERFEELKKYYERHGDCNVPSSYNELYQWACRQRKAHSLSKLSQKKVEYLQSLGFPWTINSPSPPVTSSSSNSPSNIKEDSSIYLALPLTGKMTLSCPDLSSIKPKSSELPSVARHSFDSLENIKSNNQTKLEGVQSFPVYGMTSTNTILL